jgi:hypothetical protein
MVDARLLDGKFHRIMRGLVANGRAPHYAEMAPGLGLSVEDARRLLLDVMQAYPIGWRHPETDYVASFPPLNGLPTQKSGHGGRRAEVVRPVRLRGHVRHVAVPGRHRPRRGALLGLR